MRKKAMMSEMLVLAAGLFIAMFAYGLSTFMGASQQLEVFQVQASEHAAIELDTVLDTYIRPSLEWSLAKTAIDLGRHGGVTTGTLKDGGVKDADSDYFIDDVSCLKYNMSGGEPVIFWTIEEGRTVGNAIPFIFYEDIGWSVDKAPWFKTIVDASKYGERIGFASMPLHILVQVFMLKDSEVELSACQASCTTLGTVTGTGVYEYELDTSGMPKADIKLKASASDDSAAIVRQALVSIYGNSTASCANRLLTQSLEAYRTGLGSPAAGNARSVLAAADTIEVLVPQFNASFLPAGSGAHGTLDPAEGFVKGLAWHEGVKATLYSDSSRTEKLASVKSYDVLDEDAELRYFGMYYSATVFVNGINWLNSKLWNRLNTDFQDHSTGSVVIHCTSPGCGAAYDSCPADTTPEYTRAYFLQKINAELDSLETELNTIYSGTGMTWSLEAPSGMFDGEAPNAKKTACDAAEHNSSYQNVEYYEYQRGRYYNSGCYTTCSDGDCSCEDNTCTMHYDRRYVLKNLTILVMITDPAYRVYNPDTKSWEDLSLKLFIQTYVDDNCCDGHYCSTMSGGCSNPFTTTVPVNQPPSIDSYQPALAIVTVSSGGSQSFSVTASDADSDPITYSWTLDSSPVSIASGYTYSPTDADIGSHIISVEVQDAAGQVATQSWGVVVPSYSNPPVAEAGLAQTVCNGTAFSLNGSASFDPDVTSEPTHDCSSAYADHGISSFAWTDDQGEVIPNGICPSVTLNVIGSHTMTLAVQDADYNTATDTVPVEVTSCP